MKMAFNKCREISGEDGTVFVLEKVEQESNNKLASELAVRDAKIKQLEEELAKKDEQSKLCIEEIEMTTWQKEFLQHCFGNFEDCRVYFNGSYAVVEGKSESVKEQQLKLLKELYKLKEGTLDITPAMHSILCSEEGKQYLLSLNTNRLIGAKVFLHDKSLFVVATSHHAFKDAMDFLNGTLNYKEASTSDTEIPTEKLQFLKFSIEQKFLVKISWNDKETEIYAEGIKDDVFESIREIKTLMLEHVAHEKSFAVTAFQKVEQESNNKLASELAVRDEKIKQLEEILAKKYDQATQCIEKIEMTTWQKEFLPHCFGHFGDCHVYFNGSFAVIQGKSESVKYQQFKLLKELNKLKEGPLYITPAMHSILCKEEGKQYLLSVNTNRLNGAKLFLHDKSLLVVATSDHAFKDAMDFLNGTLNYKETSTSDAEIPTEKLQLLKCSIEKKFLVKMSWNDKETEIYVEGIKEDVFESIREIKTLMLEYVDHDKLFAFTGLHPKLLHKFYDDKIRQCLQLVKTVDYSSTEAGIDITFKPDRKVLQLVQRKPWDLRSAKSKASTSKNAPHEEKDFRSKYVRPTGKIGYTRGTGNNHGRIHTFSTPSHNEDNCDEMKSEINKANNTKLNSFRGRGGAIFRLSDQANSFQTSGLPVYNKRFDESGIHGNWNLDAPIFKPIMSKQNSIGHTSLENIDQDTSSSFATGIRPQEETQGASCSENLPAHKAFHKVKQESNNKLAGELVRRDKKIKQLEEELAKKDDQAKQCIEKIEMTTWQVEFLPHCFGNFEDFRVYFNGSFAVIQGKSESVKEQQLKLLKELNKLKEGPLDITPAMHSILCSEEGKQYLLSLNTNHLNGAKVFVHDKSLFVVATSDHAFKGAMDFLNGTFNYKETSTSNAEIPTEKLQFLKLSIEKKFLVKISWNDEETEIYVEGIKEDVFESIIEIKTLMLEHVDHEKSFAFTGLHAKLLHKFYDDKIQQCLQLVKTVDYSPTEAGIDIIFKGDRKVIQQVHRKLTELQTKVMVKSWDLRSEFKKHEELMLIAKGFASYKMKKKIDNFEVTKKCIVSHKLPGLESFKMGTSKKAQQPYHPISKLRVKSYAAATIQTETKLMALNAKSVSFPVLGCGRAYRFPASDVAEITLTSIKSSQFEQALEKVVLLAPDTELFKEFKNKASKHFQLSPTKETAVQDVGATSASVPDVTISDDEDEHSNDKEGDSEEDVVEVLQHDFKSSHSAEISIIALCDSDIENMWSDLKRAICKVCLHTQYYNQEIVNFWPRDSRHRILQKAIKSCVWVESSLNPDTKMPGFIIKGEREQVEKVSKTINEELVGLSSHLPKNRIKSPKAPKRGTCEFLKHAAESDELFPSYWKLNSSNPEKVILEKFKVVFRSHRTMKLKYLVDVDSETKEAIKKLINKTWDPTYVGQGNDAAGLSHRKIKVLDVQRIENMNLFELYLAQRKQLFKKMCSQNHICPDVRKIPRSKGRIITTENLESFMKEELYYEVNEHYLFHGTKSPEAIASYGIDPRVSSEDGMFGKGIYTAESFIKSDQYTDSCTKRTPPGTTLYMILARVLLGNIFLCDDKHPSVVNRQAKKLTRPPCIHCRKDTCSCPEQELYDSVMGDGKWIFREFVVYDRNHCYPEYLISYQRA